MILRLSREIVALKMKRIVLVEAEKNTIGPGICIQIDTSFYGEKIRERSLRTLYIAFSDLAGAGRRPIL